MDIPPTAFHQIVFREITVQKRELARALAVLILAVGKKGFAGEGTGLIWALPSPVASPDQYILSSKVAKV